MKLNMRINRFIIFIMAFVTGVNTACNKGDDSLNENVVTSVYKVAIIMPGNEKERWQDIVKWSEENMQKAQMGLKQKVELNVEWQDEDAEGWENFAERVANDEKYVAIIGPKSSVKAASVAEMCKKAEKPLILPVATSTEFQRIYAGCQYVWNLSQSDITQCELLIGQAIMSNRKEISLLTPDNDYGKSFSDWFSFQAIEMGMKVNSINIYSSENTIREVIRKQHSLNMKYNKALIFVPGSNEDALALDDELNRLREEDGVFFDFPLLLCSDMMNSAALLKELKYPSYEGISPSATPESGFNSFYKARFDREPICGEAHLFDAITLLMCALTYQEATEGVNLNESILACVDGREEWNGSWLHDDMMNTLSMLRNGVAVNLGGVTGDWTFDERTHASVLNTTYCNWVQANGKYVVLGYVSTDGGANTISSSQAWELKNSQMMSFNTNQKDFEYPELENRWAVVIGASDDWANYRHQADALAMYQLLKRHGYNDDNIILITEDNIAYNPKNIYPGVVKVIPDGENLYTDVKVDYKLSELALDDLQRILTGQESEKLPEVVKSTGNDNVIMFWCGHGYPGRLAWGSTEYVYGNELRKMIENMTYRKLFFALDACYSGTIGEACEGLPGLIAMTAANAYEPSKADMIDPELGLWLSNGFTRAFQETIDTDTHISLSDLYYKLARETVGSHAMAYNMAYYGNMYHNDMSEFLE